MTHLPNIHRYKDGVVSEWNLQYNRKSATCFVGRKNLVVNIGIVLVKTSRLPFEQNSLWVLLACGFFGRNEKLLVNNMRFTDRVSYH
jgi:hypothetical protein